MKMLNFKAYFKTHFKERLPFLFYASVISLILTLAVALTASAYKPYNGAWYQGYELRYKATLYISSTVLCCLSYLAPALEFAPFKRRRNLDMYYALPISRRLLGIVHYLTGLISVLVPFVISFLSNLFVMLARGNDIYGKPYFRLEYMPQYLIISLLFGFIMYSFFTFVFNEANTTVDGCIFMFIYTFILFLLFCVPDALYDSDFTAELQNYSSMGTPWVYVDEYTSDFQSLMIAKNIDSTKPFWNSHVSLMFLCIWVLIGALSAVGFLLRFGKVRTEKTEEISSTWFGYKILIPLIAFAIFTFDPGTILWIVVLISAFIGYTVYRRSFKYKKSDLIILGILALLFLF